MIIPQVLIIIALLLACVFYLSITFGKKLPAEFNGWSKFRQWPLWFWSGPVGIILWVVAMTITFYIKG